jgi:hypothetical protein
MQYMLLIYSDPAREPTYGTPEFDTMMKGYFDLNETLKAAGVLRGGEALMGAATATSLRIKGGQVETMDGPFAETRETLGGYYLIEVPDLDSALHYGAMIPAAHYGTVEVRALMNYNPTGH